MLCFAVELSYLRKNLYKADSSIKRTFFFFFAPMVSALRNSTVCSKFTGEHPCRSVISIMSLCSFIEIVLRPEYSSVNFVRVFRTLFYKNTSRELLNVFFSEIYRQHQHRSRKNRFAGSTKSKIAVFA